jgi:diguanylate cyclase (GGDEF)-like protein
MVHFEVTVESFRRALAGASRSAVLRVLDARTGHTIMRGDRPQRIGAPLGERTDARLASLARRADRAGVVRVGDRLAAYRRVAHVTGNSNQWLVMATSTAPVPALFGDLGLGPIALLLLALALAALGALGLSAQQRELVRHAETDALTGLPNRRRLVSELDRRVARADSRPLVLVLLDLNGFKGYNDSFGHLAGDALLQRLGGALAAAVAGHGHAYRLGGDEFCVLGAAEAAGELELRALAALSEHGEGFTITASSGTVLVPEDAATSTDALRLADQRMYTAKVSGRPGAGSQAKDALLQALVERHPSLGTHSHGVADLAAAVATELGLEERECARVRLAAELHDIGKVAIPDAILDKPGRLDAEEMAFIRRHTVIGERILSSAPSLATAAELVRSSHERYDGGGYPDGIAGEEIPLGARIVAVCDAFDAMIAERPYSPAKTVDAAVAELERCAGAQFDRRVVEAFAAVLSAQRAAPVGS